MSINTVSIIDYNCGNITSLKNILYHLGVKVRMCKTNKDDLSSAKRIILPGVGSFGYGMQQLEESGVLYALTKAVIDDKIPILGICLGAQLFFESSEESPLSKGLGWISGTVKKLSPTNNQPVPHNGWSYTTFISDNNEKAPPKVFYYTHSYYMDPLDTSTIKGVCNYSEDFSAIVEKNNILACQFHPEKSHISGMEFLSNFLKV